MKLTELQKLIREEVRKALSEATGESMYDYDRIMSKISDKLNTYDDYRMDRLFSNAESIFGASQMAKPKTKGAFIAKAILDGQSGDYLHYNSNGAPWNGEEYSLKDVVRVAKDLNLIK